MAQKFQNYRETDLSVLEKAYQIRAVENAFLKLFQDGLLRGTVHTCVGQEFSAVSICNNLSNQDFVVSNHRGHGHFIAHTGKVEALISELLGKHNGASKGIGGSQHLYNENFVSNGIQGSIVPVAAGIAYGKKLRKERSISVVFIGDGTLGEGAFYEAMNLVSLFNLPLLIVLEDNDIAQSTPQSQNLSGTVIGRCNAFGIKYYDTSTDNLDDLFLITKQAVNFVRSESKPAFCHIKTNRLNAHSKGDDTREAILIKKLIKTDPINKYFENGDELNIKKSVNQDIDLAVEKSKKAENPSDEYISKSFSTYPKIEFSIYNPFQSEERMNKRIQLALKQCLTSRSNTILLGEDIESPYGGAFKVTEGLSIEFPDRVVNTPISELGITGLANGLALEGFIPFVEIMFGDFSSLIVDQLLNGSVKFRDMFGGQIECPIKIRLPMGAGGGYGPTHSQSIEKIFMAIDGLEIVALNRLIDPIMVYENILNSKNPSMILEHKSDYKKKFDLSASTLNEFYISNENFPTILCKYKNKEPTITIYTYGANVETALDLQKQLFINEEKFAQVVVFSKLSNIALEMLEITTLNISDVIIIEDGTPKHGFGSEIIANLAADLKRNLNFRRMGAKHHIIPACYELEQKVLVSAKDYWGK